ncbi:MAG: hypothetical protein K5840_06595 [Eubacterium sp.]|nr:hypothetical protein [Eubacterium sp.]
MAERYYIGSLEIVIGAPDDLQFNLWENRFTVPVLDVTHSVNVDFELTDEIPGLSGEGFSIQNATSYDTPEGELRVYRIPDECAYSIYDREKDRVTVFVVRDKYAVFKYGFRPWYYMHLEELLLLNDALILHSAGIVVRGGAIAFSAPSGTGKTTQANLWHRYRDGVEDLNGDKNLLQRLPDGTWRMCGFPIYGSSELCEQTAVPIRAIVIVRRGQSDVAVTLDTVEKIRLIYGEINLFTGSREYVERALDLVIDFVDKTDVVGLSCTMEETAVAALEEYLDGTV